MPEEIKKSMKFIYVDTVDEVIDASLEPIAAKKKTKPAATKKNSKTTSREKKKNVKDTARRR